MRRALPGSVGEQCYNLTASPSLLGGGRVGPAGVWGGADQQLFVHLMSTNWTLGMCGGGGATAEDLGTWWSRMSWRHEIALGASPAERVSVVGAEVGGVTPSLAEEEEEAVDFGRWRRGVMTSAWRRLREEACTNSEGTSGGWSPALQVVNGSNRCHGLTPLPSTSARANIKAHSNTHTDGIVKHLSTEMKGLVTKCGGPAT